MCGSLLSKFKTRSNKVVPASSTESLTQERVKESISVDAKTVCLALPSGKSIVSRNNILEVRPYDSTTEKSWFHSPPSAHSTACTSEKQTEPEIRCAPESEPTCVEDHAKQKPDFESTTQWNPSSNLQERKSISALLTACCVSERELRQDKIKTKNKAVADIKEVETELDSKFKDENNSESSIKEISVKPLSRSAATSQVSDGKIKNATESAICLNGGCREPGAAFIVKKDSFTCLQPTPSADQVSKSTNERDSETDEKEDQIEPDNSTNVCLECCETTCDSKRLTTKADSGSLIDCDSASGLDEKGSELVLQPVSGCDPVVRRKKNATEPATELNIECHLNAWAQEKETNTVFQSEIAIKSCGGITEKQAFTDCKPAFNRRRASFLSAGDFGCTADFVSEAGSEAGARTAPIVIASDSIAAAAAQNDSDANLEGKVGKLCCNIVTRKSFCLLEQEKEETEQNSEDTEHLPTAEIVLVNIEHKNTCLAEIASCPQLKKTEIHSKPDFYYHSAAEVMKSVPEAGDQLDVRCDSKASMRATSKNDDAVTIEKDVEKKDITIKQTQEKEVSSTDQEASGSENGGSYEKKRPAHTKSFPSASASAMATIQGEPHAAFSKPKEDTMNAHASAANEDDGRSLENDQPNQGSDFKISRRIIIKGVAKKTKEERTTEKSGLFNPSTSQRHSEPAVTPGKQEVLFERARKELEERIVKMTTNRDHPNYKFLSANKELLLSKARDELEKRLLKIASSPKEAVLSPRKRKPTIQENQKATCADNCETALALASARRLFEKTFREKMAAFQRGLMSDNSLRWFTLAKTKNYMAFNVFCARKNERNILLSARLPFNLRKFDVTHQLTTEAIKAKLGRAQENRLRELERVRRRAHRLGRRRGGDEGNNRKGVG